MEYNEQNFEQQEPVVFKEKNESSSSWVWYLILALLILGLLGWFGFIKGWFGGKKPVQKKPMTQVNQLNDKKNNPLLEDAQNINAPIDSIKINTLEGFPVQKQLVVEGFLLGGCTYLNEPKVIRSGNDFYVNLTTYQEGEMCTTALVPYKRVIDIDVLGLPAGTYRVSVNGRETQFEIEQDNKIDFGAGAEK